MPDTELFKFQLIITGRILGHDRKDAEDRVRTGLSLTLPIHEAIDSLIINTEAVMDELRGRFK